jgi:hypothetical protein
MAEDNFRNDIIAWQQDIEDYKFKTVSRIMPQHNKINDWIENRY